MVSRQSDGARGRHVRKGECKCVPPVTRADPYLHGLAPTAKPTATELSCLPDGPAQAEPGHDFRKGKRRKHEPWTETAGGFDAG